MSGPTIPRVAWSILPLAIGAAGAVAVALLAPGGMLHIEIPLATVLLATGAIGTAVLLLVLAVLPALRIRRAAEIDAAVKQAVTAEHDGHRRFLARLDHELKNPMTAIRAALAGDQPLPADNVRIASEQAARLSGLIGELRALASLETRELERSLVFLPDIAAEEAAAIRDELTARGIGRELVTDFPTVPWPQPPVVGDPDLLAVAIRNLMLNAVKYSDEGARIEVRGSEDGGFAVVDIADTGWGIRAADLPFVWDELWRSDDARVREGSGLGLPLVRAIVGRHHGEVTLRSSPGRGTTVRLRLPAAPDRDSLPQGRRHG